MLLKPVSDRDESERAFTTFRERFVRGADVFPRHGVGYQGGGQKCDVFWRDAEEIWGLFEPRVAKGRFWICFGIENPTSTFSLTITVETNPPLEGINRRCAGVFLRDDQGNVCIAHNGRVGGGRKGIGGRAFREYVHSGRWEDVNWPDGGISQFWVISRVDALDLPARIADFVREVVSFKEWVVSRVD